MVRKYKLKSGNLIRCWYSDAGSFLGQGELVVLNSKGNEKEYYTFDSLKDDPTINYHGEVIHVNNFEYCTVDELIDKINKKIDPITDSDRAFDIEENLLNTMLRDTENVGLVGEVECFSTVIPKLGIGFKGSCSNKVKVLLVPFEHRYKKEEWYYKVEFRPEDKNLIGLVGSTEWYLSDLVSLIALNEYELVNVKKYREKYTTDGVNTDKIKPLVIV